MAEASRSRGWYLADEVGRLAGVSSGEIGQWARHGYIRSSRSCGRPRVYSFGDVAEAIVVHELLEHRVPSKEIRNTVRALRAVYGDWPLTSADLKLSERSGAPRVLLREDGHYFDLGATGTYQKWLDAARLTELRDILRRGGWAVRHRPEITEIEVDPNRLSGRPTIRGRRVAVDLVAQLGRNDQGREILHEDYELTDKEINDAIAWRDAVGAFDRAA